MKLLDISTKKYPNTFTMVDDEDYDWIVAMGKWHVAVHKNRAYVKKNMNTGHKKSLIRLHVVIMKTPSKKPAKPKARKQKPFMEAGKYLDRSGMIREGDYALLDIKKLRCFWWIVFLFCAGVFNGPKIWAFPLNKPIGYGEIGSPPFVKSVPVYDGQPDVDHFFTTPPGLIAFQKIPPVRIGQKGSPRCVLVRRDNFRPLMLNGDVLYIVVEKDPNLIFPIYVNTGYDFNVISWGFPCILDPYFCFWPSRKWEPFAAVYLEKRASFDFIDKYVSPEFSLFLFRGVVYRPTNKDGLPSEEPAMGKQKPDNEPVGHKLPVYLTHGILEAELGIGLAIIFSTIAFLLGVLAAKIWR